MNFMLPICRYEEPLGRSAGSARDWRIIQMAVGACIRDSQVIKLKRDLSDGKQQLQR